MNVQVPYSILLCICSLLFPILSASQQPSGESGSAAGLRVNQERLQQSLQALADYGRNEDGAPNRVAFSDGDLEGRAYVLGLMQEAGLETRIDAAGNIIGLRPGRDAEKPPIAFGSHIDMVPLGGNYDGCVGSLAAIEVIRTLNENNIRTTHPLEVLIFSNEEGGVMGSRAMVGSLKPGALQVVNSTGYTMGEGIQRLGGDTLLLAEARRNPGSMAAFLELHIEQGGILDAEQLDIGVVEGIVGLNWWEVTIDGFANHAGTTPMELRQDALLAAAQFIQAVNEEARSMEGQQVATVGRIRAFPGAPNVIPGKVRLSLEIRDLSEAVIMALYDRIRRRGQAIAAATDTQFSFEPLDTTGKPALTDPKIRQIIRASAESLGLKSLPMRSGAGHDAQDIALIAPVGMIFVPSRDGISHSPREYTAPEDITNGANVLLHSILALDRGND